MESQKPYCREGESESHIALTFAIVSVITFALAAIGVWSIFL